MGDHFSSSTKGGKQTSSKFKMQFLVLILSVSLAYGAVAPQKREAEAKPDKSYSSGPQCHDKKDRQCHKTPKQASRQECHEEYDVVVDTTYIEECQDIITTHCQETFQQISHSSAVVGHDSKVVAHGHSGYGYGDTVLESVSLMLSQGLMLRLMRSLESRPTLLVLSV